MPDLSPQYCEPKDVVEEKLTPLLRVHSARSCHKLEDSGTAHNLAVVCTAGTMYKDNRASAVSFSIDNELNLRQTMHYKCLKSNFKYSKHASFTLLSDSHRYSWRR